MIFVPENVEPITRAQLEWAAETIYELANIGKNASKFDCEYKFIKAQAIILAYQIQSGQIK